MYRTIILALTLLLASTAYALEVSLEFLQARSNGQDITVEWRSDSERGLSRYEVERAGNDKVFRSVGVVDARGIQQYRFVDKDVFMKDDSSPGSTIQRASFLYRLKFVGSDNAVSYSNTVNVSHSVSSVRRTWGMIKEMFR